MRTRGAVGKSGFDPGHYAPRLRMLVRAMLKSARRPFVPLVRLWIRFAPFSVGKYTMFKYFGGAGHRYTVRTCFGARMTGSTTDLIERYIYYFGVWEHDVTHWVVGQLSDGDVFVDVGAHVGYYTLLAASLVGEDGRVVAIEASPESYGRLGEHVRLNHLGNVRTVWAAAVDRTCEVTLFAAEAGNRGGASLLPEAPTATGLGRVEGLPLSRLLSPEEIGRARVIKIDVEGAEWWVLRGLAPAFGRLRADAEIVVELNPVKLGAIGVGMAEVLEFMAARGFRAQALKNPYDVSAYTRPEAPSPPEPLDVVADHPVDVVFSRSRGADDT